MSNKGISGLAASIFALFCTTMFLQTSFIPNIVSDSLASTDTIRSTSYSKTFPALNTLEDLDGQKVIAIGSSIIQYSVDGKCISDTIDTPDTFVFNLGVSGANPYTEILQIPAIIRASPEIVMIDLGPNGLWDFYESESLDEYIRFRFTINSIGMGNEDIGEWTNLIRQRDKQWIAFNDIERIQLTQSYSRITAEKILLKEFDEYFEESFEEIKYKEYAPEPDSEGWVDYLMTPRFLAPKYENLNDSDVQILIDDKMKSKKKQGVYNPHFDGTLNHEAYEYMIQELTDAGIHVLLVATPHHSMVYPHLDDGQLDGFNATMDRYETEYGATSLNMYWETWDNSMFRDRSHLGHNGREYFCERVSPVIDEILSER